MAGRLTTMASFATVSVILGGLISAPSDAASVEHDNLPPVTPMTASVHTSASVVARVLAVSAGPVDKLKMVAVDQPMTRRIPIGCDRLVSVLARTTASRQIGRCLT